MGLCAQCKNGSTCGFRQPGTWVDECELFEQNQQTARNQTPLDWPDADEAEKGENPSQSRSAIKARNEYTDSQKKT